MIKVKKLHCHVGVMIGSSTHLAISAEKMKLDMTMGADGVFVVPLDKKQPPVFIPYGTISDAHLDADSYNEFRAAKDAVAKDLKPKK